MVCMGCEGAARLTRKPAHNHLMPQNRSLIFNKVEHLVGNNSGQIVIWNMGDGISPLDMYI